jgi:hypothetical protein
LRLRDEPGDLESPCFGIDRGNRRVTAGEETIERSYEMLRVNRPSSGVESVNVMNQAGRTQMASGVNGFESD